MPDRHTPPPTENGWYVLHDFRRIDWDTWREASEQAREHALSEGIEYLESSLAVANADEGESALYSMLGHDADLLVLHLRPTTAQLDTLQRRFERTAFAEFTDRAHSFVSVTEASGYSERARKHFYPETDESSTLARYIDSRLEPSVPDATHVCFHPMDKRRDPGQNWYDLPFEERAEHVDAHGDIAREYDGRVIRMITGAIALDDWEWGVTLWGDDLTEIKDLLHEMRFSPSTSKYAEFGSFQVGRRFPPADLPALLAGDPVPTDSAATGEPEQTALPADTASTDTGTTDETGSDETPPAADMDSSVETVEDDEMSGRLATLGLRESEDYEPGSTGLVVYSTADAQQLAEEVHSLRENFEHYDTHVLTSVRASQGRSAVVSIWETERAAGTAARSLTDLSEASKSVSGPLGESREREPEKTATTDSGHAAGVSSEIRAEFAELNIYAGQLHGEDVFVLVLYSTADIDRLRDAVTDLASGFDRYDSHERTTVYEDSNRDRAAVVSLWATGDAASNASDHLTDLPGTVGWADETDGLRTMGMFYTVKPEHRPEFVETFAEVGEMLDGVDGHRETTLLVNVGDDNDMFIASRWDQKGDAMEFFSSDAFAKMVDWGQDVLADRPRHVFLA
jgi:chlorite dismutase